MRLRFKMNFTYISYTHQERTILGNTNPQRHWILNTAFLHSKDQAQREEVASGANVFLLVQSFQWEEGFFAKHPQAATMFLRPSS